MFYSCKGIYDKLSKNVYKIFEMQVATVNNSGWFVNQAENWVFCIMFSIDMSTIGKGKPKNMSISFEDFIKGTTFKQNHFMKFIFDKLLSQK